MNAPANFPHREPTLEERLRFIDITFECVTDAERDLIERGEISPHKPLFCNGPSERSKRIGREAMRLRAMRVWDEGLPRSLLGPVDDYCGEVRPLPVFVGMAGAGL